MKPNEFRDRSGVRLSCGRPAVSRCTARCGWLCFPSLSALSKFSSALHQGVWRRPETSAQIKRPNSLNHSGFSPFSSVVHPPSLCCFWFMHHPGQTVFFCSVLFWVFFLGGSMCTSSKAVLLQNFTKKKNSKYAHKTYIISSVNMCWGF